MMFLLAVRERNLILESLITWMFEKVVKGLPVLLSSIRHNETTFFKQFIQ